MGLVGFFAAANEAYNGQINDLHIKRKRPVFNVKPIEGNPVFHVAECAGFSTISHRLGQSGYPRLYIMAGGEFLDSGSKLLVEFDGVIFEYIFIRFQQKYDYLENYSVTNTKVRLQPILTA